jgi:hypothetical protein
MAALAHDGGHMLIVALCFIAAVVVAIVAMIRNR